MFTKQIKARLRVLFPKANLSQKRIDTIVARLSKKLTEESEESDIDALLNETNEIMNFEETAKQDDRLRTLERKAKESKPSTQTQPNTTGEDDEDDEPNDDAPEWAKKLIQTNKQLATEVEQLKKGEITKTKTASARELFENSETFKDLDVKAKDFYFKNIDVDSETPIEEQIEALEETHQTLTQHASNSSSYAGAPPNGSSDSKPSEEELDEIVDAL